MNNTLLSNVFCFFNHLDVFLPYPDNLLVNLKSCKELVKDLLKQLPKRFEHTHDTHSALGAALQVAYKLMVSVCVCVHLIITKQKKDKILLFKKR